MPSETSLNAWLTASSTPNGVEDDNSVGIPPSAVVFHPICREVVPYEAGGASM
jgi:hypothetical protein